MLMGFVGAGAVGRPEGPGMILGGIWRGRNELRWFVLLAMEELAIAIAGSCQAGSSAGPLRSVWPTDVPSRRDMGLAGRHSTRGQLRNVRHPTLGPDWGLGQRVGLGPWLLLEVPKTPIHTSLSAHSQSYKGGLLLSLLWLVLDNLLRGPAL